SAQRVQITALRLAWPPELDRLDRIRFKSRTIWDRGDSHPPTSIDPGEWKWGVSRRVDPGAQETLTFIFTGGSSSEEYDLEITLDGVCAISW
ncbi:MAG: hypothetical protein MUO23_07920, partial [Anaerolineales bacterium]|nr:hypothetical protein [Anaerolineales bacterium]